MQKDVQYLTQALETLRFLSGLDERLMKPLKTLFEFLSVVPHFPKLSPELGKLIFMQCSKQHEIARLIEHSLEQSALPNRAPVTCICLKGMLSYHRLPLGNARLLVQ